jgi:hypothetical protein
MSTGFLRKLELAAEAANAVMPVHARLQLKSEGLETLKLELDDHLGEGVVLEFSGRIRCVACDGATRRSYGGGYCYRCFSTLARCDLCVVSPDRCHYHLGTCREPAWGESFCMSEHVVYLANSSGLKVGITRAGHEHGRWMDQGAREALVILRASTRRDAGLAESAIAGQLPDRTDWRELLAGDAPPVDLAEQRERLRARRDLDLPAGVSWTEGAAGSFSYPVLSYGAPLKQLHGEPAQSLAGNLLGVKGQYLLLSTGVFNVRRHQGYEVTVSFRAPSAEPPVSASDQLVLF